MKLYKSNVPELYLGRKKSDAIKVKITSSKDSTDFFRKVWDEDTIEYCESAIVMYLNRANNTIGYYKVSQGGLSSTVIDIRMVLGAALKCGASAIIIAHNHPSGQMNPSEEDKNITKKLKDGCAILDIQLLDHCILTENSFYSFTDEGML